ncbi:hypothetical protein Bca4012_066145 [Brassica carinata]
MRKQTVESGSETGRAIQLVCTDENGKLKMDPEAIGALQKLKGPSLESETSPCLKFFTFLLLQPLLPLLHPLAIGEAPQFMDPLKMLTCMAQVHRGLLRGNGGGSVQDEHKQDLIRLSTAQNEDKDGVRPNGVLGQILFDV